MSPHSVAAAPAAGGAHGCGRPLRSLGVGRGARGSSADGGYRGTGCARLGARGKVAGRRTAGGARRARAALRAHCIVKDLVGRASSLGAGGTGGSRARIGRNRRGISGRSRGARLAGRNAANTFIAERGCTTQTRGAAGTRSTSANLASLVDVAALVGKGSLAVQSAALASNELPGLFLGHLLVVLAAGVAGGVGVGSRDISYSIYVEKAVSPCSTSRMDKQASRSPSLSAPEEKGQNRTVYEIYEAVHQNMLIRPRPRFSIWHPPCDCKCYTAEGGLLRWYCCSVCRLRSSRSRCAAILLFACITCSASLEPREDW